MDANETSGLRQTSSEGKRFPALCLKLQYLQIESQDFMLQPDLFTFAKDIITLHAECGSPLKSFTLTHYWSGSRFDLIGRDGHFTMARSVLAQEDAIFQLDI